MDQTRPLHAKTAIVTGGGTGIGAALATRLAAQGAFVVVGYRSSQKEAEEVALRCRELGGDGIAVQGDVASDNDCRKLAAAGSGRIDVLVNNAGTTKEVPIGDLEATSAEDFRRIYDVNVIGAFQMIRAAREGLEAASAEGMPSAVVNISSIAGVSGRGSSLAYVASKSALNGMTISLARALAPMIRVNAVCPGFVDSSWWGTEDNEKRSALRDYFARTTPLRVASTPEVIADTALPFCLPATRHVTGETLLVDAGMHLMMGPES
jgi:NAD(P)-dependent dehydrogenase (short-subunit alcohol dehydrogenase family)